MTSQEPLELVSDSDPVYLEVKKDFDSQHIKIEKIERIKITGAQDVFHQEKELMSKHSSTSEIKVMSLYHGTKDTLDQVLSEGLDQRNLKHFGHFGRGIYFSDNPTFARIECESLEIPKVIYRCKVLLGNSKVYLKDATDSELTREPREVVDGKKIVYDSVQGEVGGFTHYVVYEKRRVLIEYAIHYSASQTLPCLPLVARSRKKQPGGSINGSDNEGSCDSEGSGSDNDGFHTPDEEFEDIKIKKKKKKSSRRGPNEIISTALNYMMVNKTKFTTPQYEELLQLFYKTYLCQSDKEKPSQPIDDKLQQFIHILPNANELEAKIFLEVYSRDVDTAILNYLNITK